MKYFVQFVVTVGSCSSLGVRKLEHGLQDMEQLTRMRLSTKQATPFLACAGFRLATTNGLCWPRRKFGGRDV